MMEIDLQQSEPRYTLSGLTRDEFVVLKEIHKAMRMGKTGHPDFEVSDFQFMGMASKGTMSTFPVAGASRKDGMGLLAIHAMPPIGLHGIFNQMEPFMVQCMMRMVYDTMVNGHAMMKLRQDSAVNFLPIFRS